jgi:hypothetical protein
MRLYFNVILPPYALIITTRIKYVQIVCKNDDMSDRDFLVENKDWEEKRRMSFGSSSEKRADC